MAPESPDMNVSAPALHVYDRDIQSSECTAQEKGDWLIYMVGQ